METNLRQRSDASGSESTTKENEEDHDKISPEEKTKGFLKNIISIRKYITVEPLLACYIMPSVLSALAVQNLNLEKACRVNQNYGDDICSKLISQDVENLTQEVLQVQTLVANMAAWKTPLQTAIPALMILFIGAWSDRTGRRSPCMLMPMFGELISAVGLIFCTYYFLEWSLEVAGFIEAIPPALSGGWTTMFMAVFSYISDHTTLEERTFRIGIVNVFVSIGIPIGTALSGILTRELGFYGIFVISICFYIGGFLYGIFRIKDTRKPVDETLVNRNCCVEFFNPKYVTDTLMVAFKTRTGSRRLRVLLLMLVFVVLAGPIYGEVAVGYLFTRIRFNFTEVDYSIYATYSVIINLIGTIVTLTWLSRHLQLDDTLIGALACVSKIAASFVYAFAPTRAWFYLAPVVDIIGGTGNIAIRSIASKLVDPSETGTADIND